MVEAYSRGGLIRERGIFESGGLFIQVNSRVGAFFKDISEQIKNIYVYYTFDELYYVNIVFITNHVFRSVTKYEIE